ncbi:MAG: hypothetical protein AAF594_17720, partial [Bacteroidota bacterium]
TASVVAGTVLDVTVAARFARFGVWLVAVLHLVFSPLVLFSWAISEGDGAGEYRDKLPTGWRRGLSGVLGLVILACLVGAGWTWTAAAYTVAMAVSFVMRHSATYYADIEASASAPQTA